MHDFFENFSHFHLLFYFQGSYSDQVSKLSHQLGHSLSQMQVLEGKDIEVKVYFICIVKASMGRTLGPLQYPVLHRTSYGNFERLGGTGSRNDPSFGKK